MKLLTKEIEKEFEKKPIGYYSDKTLKEVLDAPVVAKFFNPMGAGRWFALEGSKMENGDYELYGYCHLGDDEMAEFGYFYLSELESMRLPYGMKIERDLYIAENSPLKDELRNVGIKYPSFWSIDEEDNEME